MHGIRCGRWVGGWVGEWSPTVQKRPVRLDAGSKDEMTGTYRVEKLGHTTAGAWLGHQLLLGSPHCCHFRVGVPRGSEEILGWVL